MKYRPQINKANRALPLILPLLANGELSSVDIIKKLRIDKTKVLYALARLSRLELICHRYEMTNSAEKPQHSIWRINYYEDKKTGTKSKRTLKPETDVSDTPVRTDTSKIRSHNKTASIRKTQRKTRAVRGKRN